MSPITRSVSILMRARVGAGWARTIHGAAARTVAKLRRESDVAVFMGLHQNRSMSYGTGVRKGVAVGRRERTMRSKATAGLSLLSKLAQHFRRVQRPPSDGVNRARSPSNIFDSGVSSRISKLSISKR